MASLTAAVPAAARPPRPALITWTIASLLLGVALVVYLQVAILRSFDPPLALIFGTPALVFAALLAVLRGRWVPLLGALYWALVLAANALYFAYDLTHPEFLESFIISITMSLTALIGVAAGVGATVQNYRPACNPRLPRWFATGVSVLAGLGVGAVLVALLPRPGVSAATLAQLPALITAQTRFGQPELHAQVGVPVALRLENLDPSGHSFDIDELDVHASMPPGEAALALFTPTAPGIYTFYCNVPGHREAGMIGTLIVTP
ncbi:MAG: cupredoxin domain-containing protein [Anaerolineales bacterium]|nr:cupredoxin domain-containing protein [Anaerolineales bacterium]